MIDPKMMAYNGSVISSWIGLHVTSTVWALRIQNPAMIIIRKNVKILLRRDKGLAFV